MSHGHEAIVTPTPPGFREHKVAHHFDSAVQEFQSGKFGFWLFLATEILLFGGLFAAYFAYKGQYPETFVECGNQLNWQLGALNTSILLVSSWTMAMGVRASQLSQNKSLIIYCVLTIFGAIGFMVVKYIEYSGKLGHGIGPGIYFNPHGEWAAPFVDMEYPELFFSLYYTMTGIHGLHVVIGAILIIWVICGAMKNKYHSGNYLAVDLVGLYWHLVDLIWIFLFPLLYLVP